MAAWLICIGIFLLVRLGQIELNDKDITHASGLTLIAAGLLVWIMAPA